VEKRSHLLEVSCGDHTIGVRAHYYAYDNESFEPLEEQKLWLPNQLAHDPDSWTTPHFLNLKTGYDILVN
jgi:hypothetical protein